MNNSNMNWGMIKINGQEIPDPWDYNYTSDNLYIDSGRNTTGYAVLHLIRKNLKKLSLEWRLAGYIEEYRFLMGFIESLPSTFNVEFLHPNGSRVNFVAYKSELSTKMVSYFQETDGRIERWENISFNLIEV